METGKKLTKLFIEKIRKMPDFKKIKFIILFGSFSNKKQTKLSDIDFAVYYDGNEDERYKFRKEILGILPDNFDIQIFQDLPLYVRINVLKGKLIYVKDIKFAYDIAYETIRNFERFKKYYYDYIERRQKIC